MRARASGSCSVHPGRAAGILTSTRASGNVGAAVRLRKPASRLASEHPSGGRGRPGLRHGRIFSAAGIRRRQRASGAMTRPSGVRSRSSEIQMPWSPSRSGRTTLAAGVLTGRGGVPVGERSSASSERASGWRERPSAQPSERPTEPCDRPARAIDRPLSGNHRPLSSDGRGLQGMSARVADAPSDRGRVPGRARSYASYPHPARDVR
jgi:hypothetical protein